jgi:hypothetical protein
VNFGRGADGGPSRHPKNRSTAKLPRVSGGGFSNTASFADGADGLRKAISGFDGGSNRSVLTNLPGFTADYTIALSPAAESYGGLWRQ